MTAHPLGVEVSCDGPDEQTECPDSAAVRAQFGSMTAPQVRADGRRDGWTSRRSFGRLRDVCPTCRPARHDERNPSMPALQRLTPECLGDILEAEPDAIALFDGDMRVIGVELPLPAGVTNGDGSKTKTAMYGDRVGKDRHGHWLVVPAAVEQSGPRIPDHVVNEAQGNPDL